MANKCLIVGAGMAGLTAARTLVAAGWDVLVADKGRAVGGRMATRRIGGARFDHGAQFFTVRDERFRRAVETWLRDGVAAPWFTNEGHTRYRGVAGMRGICEHLAIGLDVRTGVRIERIEWAGKWRALAEGGEAIEADALVLTPPGPQSLGLCAAFATGLQVETLSLLAGIEFDPCIALMALLDGPSRVPAPGYARPEAGPVAWVGEKSPGAVTIHARGDWSREHWQTDESEAARLLVEAAGPYLGRPAVETQLHRWRYAQPVQMVEAPCLHDVKPGPVAFAGDAFGGPRVEGAFLSGLAAAEALLS